MNVETLVQRGKSGDFIVKSNEVKDFIYYWPLKINSIDLGLDTRLEFAVLEPFPYNQSIIGGSIKVYKEYSAKDYIVIRVFGENSRTTGQSTSTAIDFAISISESENSDALEAFGWLLDALIVTIIFAGLLTVSSVLSYIVNRHMRRRRMDRIQLADMNSHLYPTPELHSYQMQFNHDNSKPVVPISLEEFSCFHSKVVAMNVIIILPGSELYLQEGDLPRFEVGTRMVSIGSFEQQETASKGKNSKPIDNIKTSRPFFE